MAAELPPAYNTLKESKIDLHDQETDKAIPNADKESGNFGPSFEEKKDRIGFIQKDQETDKAILNADKESGNFGPSFEEKKERIGFIQKDQETDKAIPNPDKESGNFGPSFEGKKDRMGFIQKVLSLKLLQLMAASIIIFLFRYCDPIYQLMNRTNLLIFQLVSALTLVVTLVSLYYCKEARYVAPYNYVFLVAYPVSFGLFMTAISFEWFLTRLMVSWIYFMIIVFALLLYSILTLDTTIKFKTSIGLYITAEILVVCYVSTIPFMTHLSSVYIVLFFCLVIFLLTAYMLKDIQAMVSDDYRLPLTPSDFLKAAVIMHIDYRYIFMRCFNKNARSNPA